MPSENNITSEFIEIYRSHSCLWKIKSKDYMCRDLKNKAYANLVEKMKEIDPENKVGLQDKDSIIKKINSMRTAYRRELKKKKDSIKSGAAVENIYTPHLWYFNHLSFLDDQEVPRDSVSNIPIEADLDEVCTISK